MLFYVTELNNEITISKKDRHSQNVKTLIKIKDKDSRLGGHIFVQAVLKENQ